MRLVWLWIVTAAATLWYGLTVIVASITGRRGDIYYRSTQAWGRTIVRASGSRIIAHGMDRVDWSRPYVLVANHIAGFDIMALAAVLPVPFYFIGKKELNRIPFFGAAWRAAGHISIDRSNRASAIASMMAAGEKIRRDHGVVIVFPEGTRSRTGELQAFKKGAFIMAAGAGIDVLPVVIRGTDRVQPRGEMRVVPQAIEIGFLEPINGSAYAGRSDDLLTAVRTRMLEAV